MEPHRFLRRKAASKYLHEVHGVDRAASTLAKYAVIGGGPVFQRMGRDPVYTTIALDEWVASKLSGPMRSTSDKSTSLGETDGNRQQVNPSSASDNGASRRRSSSLGPSAAGVATQPAAHARGGGS
jgi:hypothetical protein